MVIMIMIKWSYKSVTSTMWLKCHVVIVGKIVIVNVTVGKCSMNILILFLMNHYLFVNQCEKKFYDSEAGQRNFSDQRHIKHDILPLILRPTTSPPSHPPNSSSVRAQEPFQRGTILLALWAHMTNHPTNKITAVTTLDGKSNCNE